MRSTLSSSGLKTTFRECECHTLQFGPFGMLCVVVADPACCLLLCLCVALGTVGGLSASGAAASWRTVLADTVSWGPRYASMHMQCACEWSVAWVFWLLSFDGREQMRSCTDHDDSKARPAAPPPSNRQATTSRGDTSRQDVCCGSAQGEAVAFECRKEHGSKCCVFAHIVTFKTGARGAGGLHPQCTITQLLLLTTTTILHARTTRTGRPPVQRCYQATAEWVRTHVTMTETAGETSSHASHSICARCQCRCAWCPASLLTHSLNRRPPRCVRRKYKDKRPEQMSWLGAQPPWMQCLIAFVVSSTTRTPVTDGMRRGLAPRRSMSDRERSHRAHLSALRSTAPRHCQQQQQ
jgi:hypothetical protein